MNPLNLLFRQGNQVLFLPQILLKLGDLEFIVPVNISISLRKKIVITEIYGADFSVKEDFGLGDYHIMVQGNIGNTESSVGAKISGVNKQINALDFLSHLTKLAKERGPLEISDVSEEFATNFIGSLARKVDQAFDIPFGGPTEPEGILNKLGITKVVILGLDIHPDSGGRYRFYLDLQSDISEEDVLEIESINLFLTEAT